MLSSRVRYAIAALTVLARNPDRPRTAERLAAVTGAPLATLAKVLQALAHAHILGTVRGPHGGVRLAQDAASISVLDVVSAVDPAAQRRMVRSEALGPCLHRRLELLRQVATLVLGRTTIAELAGKLPVDSGAASFRPAIDEILARAIDECNVARPTTASGANNEKPTTAAHHSGSANPGTNQTHRRPRT